MKKEELDKIKIRLRHSKALKSKYTEEQDEYNYVRSINTSLHIESKEEYDKTKDIHNNFIDSPEEYFKAKGVWTDWYDFMGVDTSKFIQTKADWIDFCKEEIKVTSLKTDYSVVDEYLEKCKVFEYLPREPADFYKDFKNIPAELGLNYRRRR